MRKLYYFLVAMVCFGVSFLCHAEDKRFTVIRVEPQYEKLELFLLDDFHKPFNNFTRLATALEAQQRQLRFAMNAGMYKTDFSPVGLWVVNGKTLYPLNQDNGSGNFFLKPNGVFLVSKTGARVIETSEYPALANEVRIATQSGPLLVRRSVIHPAFHATSTSKLIRNGVGVSGKQVFFVISEQPVTFYELATFFRDRLQCQDALYLDGVVSSLYYPAWHRNDFKAELGPMIGIVSE